MYCPKCGQSQVSADVRFCSRCGFPLVVVGDLLLTGGVLPALVQGNQAVGAKPKRPRRRGVKQGAGLLLIGILLIPFFGILHEVTGLPDEFMGLGGIVVLAGLLRMIFALFFEDPVPQFTPPLQPYTPPIASRLHVSAQESLPPAPGVPVNDYRPPPVHTAEMMRPPSVTDHTTRLLDKQADSAEQ
ncbi:MAG TPA: zinc ribbon domain-containing protein [Pyrinomonadaceae bacterium]|nr:zinc ribbon domain-containing protein [Pyrinomonadaceae bacterium]